MGEPPHGQTLDRIDVHGNYEPGNCRWAPIAIQARNTTRTKSLDIGGEQLCVTDAAKAVGMKRPTLHGRLAAGWSHEAALYGTRADAPPRSNARLVVWQGREMSLAKAAKLAGVKYHTALARARRGWPLADVLALGDHREVTRPCIDRSAPRKDGRFITINGARVPLAKAARDAG